ncbi:MAG: hypothetical protein EOP84_00395 [Verrucomicrobiaceae bacterium]|nr:MAG: hypothetical protein EOP84_00395 [Verrucomicrobiaceae bacterium]
MRPENPAGEILNANFAVTGEGSRFEITFESGDGKGRNSDYTQGVELIIRRLVDRHATLLGGFVNSSAANRLKIDVGLDVNLYPDDFVFPLKLARELDASSIRRSLGRAGALVGKPPKGSGNTTKRITLGIALPDGTEISADELEMELASLPAKPFQPEALPPSIQTSDPAELESLRLRYANASPKTKLRLSKRIERGAVGDRVKAANNHRCQICVELDQPPIAFHKTDGRPYAEAHHVILVSTLQPGALGPENVICVCPNHHRELHYGNASIVAEMAGFWVSLGEQKVRISKNG